jgi:hypothetical protein
MPIERMGQFELDSNHTRKIKRRSHYYAYHFPTNKYLHSDGELREDTLHNRKFSGYFDSKDQVKEAIKLFQSKYAK